MAQNYEVTYNGKAGKSRDERLPVPGIPEPFTPGETRVFTDQYLATLGVAPEDGPTWVEDIFAQQNQNRPEGLELFTLAEAKKVDPTATAGAQSGSAPENKGE